MRSAQAFPVTIGNPLVSIWIQGEMWSAPVAGFATSARSTLTRLISGRAEVTTKWTTNPQILERTQHCTYQWMTGLSTGAGYDESCCCTLLWVWGLHLTLGLLDPYPEPMLGSRPYAHYLHPMHTLMITFTCTLSCWHPNSLTSAELLLDCILPWQDNCARYRHLLTNCACVTSQVPHFHGRHIAHLDGTSGSFRLFKVLAQGSVILKQESRWQQWYVIHIPYPQLNESPEQSSEPSQISQSVFDASTFEASTGLFTHIALQVLPLNTALRTLRALLPLCWGRHNRHREVTAIAGCAQTGLYPASILQHAKCHNLFHCLSRIPLLEKTSPDGTVLVAIHV